MDRLALARMLRAEAHRGPDDEGAFSTSSVLLGHARLAVIDLTASARQPMPNETGDVWVSFNGEIYNFEALRAELRASGHRFRSNSDFEVLIHGYESWGLQGLLPRLCGMFAFALYDARPLHERKLYLVRDRLGIKPLYYAEGEDRLVFASELSAIVASGLVPAKPAEAALTSFLALGSVPGPGTAVEGVFMLEPAHYMEVCKGSRSVHRYWSLPAPAAINDARDDDIEHVRELLAESVRMRLVSDVPLGVFSSGGMDSATLIALAAKFSSSKVTTLSVVFDEPGLNEARYARVVAQRYGTDHREIRLDGQDFLGALPDVFRAMDSPTVDGVNSFFVSHAARQAGLTVVLSGVGGDEVFLGYPHFRKLRALAPFVRWLERSPRFARRHLASFGERVDGGALGWQARISRERERAQSLSSFSWSVQSGANLRARPWKRAVRDTGRSTVNARGRRSSPKRHAARVRDLPATSTSSRYGCHEHDALTRSARAIPGPRARGGRISTAASRQVFTPCQQTALDACSRCAPSAGSMGPAETRLHPPFSKLARRPPRGAQRAGARARNFREPSGGPALGRALAWACALVASVGAHSL